VHSSEGFYGFLVDMSRGNGAVMVGELPHVLQTVEIPHDACFVLQAFIFVWNSCNVIGCNCFTLLSVSEPHHTFLYGDLIRFVVSLHAFLIASRIHSMLFLFPRFPNSKELQGIMNLDVQASTLIMYDNICEDTSF
jgi:hypothetical protein